MHARQKTGTLRTLNCHHIKTPHLLSSQWKAAYHRRNIIEPLTSRAPRLDRKFFTSLRSPIKIVQQDFRSFTAVPRAAQSRHSTDLEMRVYSSVRERGHRRPSHSWHATSLFGTTRPSVRPTKECCMCDSLHVTHVTDKCAAVQRASHLWGWGEGRSRVSGMRDMQQSPLPLN